MVKKKLISAVAALSLTVTSVSSVFTAAAVSPDDYLEFSMTNIAYDASEDIQWFDIFVTNPYGDNLEEDGVFAVQCVVYCQSQYFDLVNDCTESCYGNISSNILSIDRLADDPTYDIPEGYDTAYTFALVSPDVLTPTIAKKGDLVYYFGVKVKDSTPDGVYEMKFDTKKTRAINFKGLFSDYNIPLKLNNGSITIKRQAQPETTTATTTTTTTATTTTKPVTTTTTKEITTTTNPVTTTTTKEITTTTNPVTTTTTKEITTTTNPVTTTTTKETTTTTKPVTTTTTKETTTTTKPVTTTTTKEITTTTKPVTTTTTKEITTTTNPVTTTTTKETTTTTKPVTTTTTKETTTTTKPVTTTTTKEITTTTNPVTTTTTKEITTTTKPVTTTTVTTTVTPPLKATLYGDANCDNIINISDVVSIKCYLLNCDKYSLSAQGLINADVQNKGNGINLNDGIAIQQFTLRLIKDLASL